MLHVRTRWILALVCLFSSLGAFAQEFPPAKEMVVGRKVFLALNAKVRKELKVTDAQFQKMQDAFDGAVQVEGDKIMISMGPDMDLNASEKKAMGVLDADQKKRLDEVWIQNTGAIVAADDQVAKELKLTDEQKKSVSAIIDETAKELQDMFMGGHSEESAKKAKEFREKASTKALALFTAEQKEAFEKMKGKPFKLQPDKAGG